MAKKLATFNLDDEVIEALDKTLDNVPISKSAFVNLLIGGACGVYDAHSILGDMFCAAFQQTKVNKESEISSDVQTA